MPRAHRAPGARDREALVDVGERLIEELDRGQRPPAAAVGKGAAGVELQRLIEVLASLDQLVLVEVSETAFRKCQGQVRSRLLAGLNQRSAGANAEIGG
jgi:hypothetical protein